MPNRKVDLRVPAANTPAPRPRAPSSGLPWLAILDATVLNEVSASPVPPYLLVVRTTEFYDRIIVLLVALFPEPAV